MKLSPKAKALMDAIQFCEDRITLKHTQGSMSDAVAKVRKAAIEQINDERIRNEEELREEMMG